MKVSWNYSSRRYWGSLHEGYDLFVETYGREEGLQAYNSYAVISTPYFLTTHRQFL
jgi:hypothetical protein